LSFQSLQTAAHSPDDQFSAAKHGKIKAAGPDQIARDLFSDTCTVRRNAAERRPYIQYKVSPKESFTQAKEYFRRAVAG